MNVAVIYIPENRNQVAKMYRSWINSMKEGKKKKRKHERNYQVYLAYNLLCIHFYQVNNYRHAQYVPYQQIGSNIQGHEKGKLLSISWLTSKNRNMAL